MVRLNTPRYVQHSFNLQYKMKLIPILLTALVMLVSNAATRAQVPNYVPTNGLVGWWPFNGNSNDESGNGYNLINSSVTFENDRQNMPKSAAYFSGNNSELKSQTAFSQFSSSSHQTYSFWFKNVTSNWRYIVNYASSTSVRIAICPSTLSSSKVLKIIGFEGCSGIKEFPTVGLESNWHHLIVSISRDTCNVYYDGNFIGASPHQGFSCLDPSFRFVLGNDIMISPEYYNMLLDDIGVWNRALTQQEIFNLFKGCQQSILEHPISQTVNVHENIIFTVTNSDKNATYQWQTDLGLGFQNLTNAGQYSGTLDDTLRVSNITLQNNNQNFRCISQVGSCKDTSDVAVLKVVSTNSLNDVSQSKLISVYPNPAQNNIILKTDVNLLGEHFTIADKTGRVVRYGKLSDENTTIELDDLSGGFYILSVGGNMRQVFKIIKAQ